MARPDFRSALVEAGNFWCSRCRTVQPITNFHKNSAVHHGVQNVCRTCAREQYRRDSRRNANVIR